MYALLMCVAPRKGKEMAMKSRSLDSANRCCATLRASPKGSSSLISISLVSISSAIPVTYTININHVMHFRRSLMLGSGDLVLSPVCVHSVVVCHVLEWFKLREKIRFLLLSLWDLVVALPLCRLLEILLSFGHPFLS